MSEKNKNEVDELRELKLENEKLSKELKQYFKELGERIDKTNKELGERIDKTNKAVTQTNISINGIAKSNGMFAEETIYNALAKDMAFGGIKFDDIDRNVKLHSKFLNLKGEFDVVLLNGDTLAIIETKYKVRREDVSELVDKPDNFRKLFPTYNNYKILLGIGGLCFENDVIEDAQKQGIGVLKIDNDTIEYFTNNLKKY